MLNPNDREWLPFFISDLCDIDSGCDIYDVERTIGNTPYITSSAVNNGIKYYVGNKNNTLEANCISVNRNGSVGYSFYHKYKALYSNDCRKLRLKQHNNEYVAIFITNQVMQQKDKYNYSVKMGTGRLQKQSIMLPVDVRGNPDYDFMEAYVKEQEKQKKQEYINYVCKRIAELEYNELPLFSEKSWSNFKILDLFNYRRGNQNNMNSLTVGTDMLISAKNIRNGLKGFFASNNDKKGTYQGNCITLNNDGDGGVGLAYYQPHKFLLDAHVYALYPKNAISKFAMIFITLSLSKQRVCFSHGYSISQDRLKKMKIMLPVDVQGNPDYGYMDQYAKNLILRKYQQYLDYVGA